MRRRGTAFWEGPGLLLAFGLFLLLAGLLLYLAVDGPPVLNGLALAAIGVAIVYFRDVAHDLWYARAQYSYIWPRDPEKMRPNAELEGAIGRVVWAVTGGVLVIAGVILAIQGLSI